VVGEPISLLQLGLLALAVLVVPAIFLLVFVWLLTHARRDRE